MFWPWMTQVKHSYGIRLVYGGSAVTVVGCMRLGGRHEMKRKRGSSLESSPASLSRRSDRDTLDTAMNKSVSSDGNEEKNSERDCGLPDMNAIECAGC